MTTLAEELAANTTERRKVLADEDWQTIDGSIKALQATGIRDAVIGKGDQAPDFELPNAKGEMVSSKARRANGPLIIKFYRGA